jgi:hypothetical protein
MKPQTSVHELINAMRPPPLPPGRVDRWKAKIALFLLVIAGITILGAANVVATGEALAKMSPGLFGVKLSYFLPILAGFKGWHRLHFGHVCGAGFFLFTAFSWHFASRELFLTRGMELDEHEFHVSRLRIAGRAACIALFVLDLVLFYIGSSAVNSWSGRYTFSGLLITAMYGLFAVVFALGYLVLSHRVQQLRRTKV